MNKKIHIGKRELWDEKEEKFVYTSEQTLILEHSLVTVSEWESKYHKPFLSTDKTAEEMLDYIHMMVQSDDEKVKDSIMALTKSQIEDIVNYINDPMTATWFSDDYDSEGKKKKVDKSKSKKGEVITNELIYYWMTALNIPFECEHWHLSRLLTLIRVCSIKNEPKDKKKKKMTSAELNSRRALMEARRKMHNTNG